MNKISLSATALVIALVFSLLPMAVSAYGTETKIADMIAGGGNTDGAIDVGDVLAWDDGTTLYVKYVIVDDTPGDPRDDWRIASTHLDVGDASLTGIAMTRDMNPVPGKFEYVPISVSDDEVLYGIPLAGLGDRLTIAAHAVVQQRGGLEALEYSLPETATVVVVHESSASFFSMSVTNGGFLNTDGGPVEAWCVDLSRFIAERVSYPVKVYSSYEALPAGLVDHPENLDLVNWVINHDFVGKASPWGGYYNWGEVQWAIWTLIDDQTTGPNIAHNEYRVAEIVAAAIASGEGYVPPCNGMIALLFAPFSGMVINHQVVIGLFCVGELGIPCQPCEETAWGIAGGIYGTDGLGDGLGPQNEFNPSKSWAEYIPYTVGAV